MVYTLYVFVTYSVDVDVKNINPRQKVISHFGEVLRVDSGSYCTHAGSSPDDQDIARGNSITGNSRLHDTDGARWQRRGDGT